MSSFSVPSPTRVTQLGPKQMPAHAAVSAAGEER